MGRNERHAGDFEQPQNFSPILLPLLATRSTIELPHLGLAIRRYLFYFIVAPNFKIGKIAAVEKKRSIVNPIRG
jgi:hypothetical protein